MFIDANDEKWTLQKIKSISRVEPLSVCFKDEFGNSFLNRVKECLGKPVLLSLAIPFECFVEKNGMEHEKRKGFLMVNDFVGMMYAYGIVEKLKSDYISLMTKKDMHALRKKGVLCFLDYGTVYIEFTRNIWLEKESMGKGLTHSFLKGFCKSSKRYLYDFQNRRPRILQKEEEEKTMKNDYFQQLKKCYHHKCVEMLEDLAKEGFSYTVQTTEETEEKKVKCIIYLKHVESKQAFEKMKKKRYLKRAIEETKQKELWILEKVPILTDEDTMYLEEWQCEWLNVPCIEIQKAP